MKRGTAVALVAGAGLLAWIAWRRARADCVLLYITDTHDGAHGNNESLIESMLAQSGVTAVLHGGDIADEPRFWPVWWDDPFREVHERWPVHAASGNHDVSSTENASEFRERFGDLPRKVSCGSADIFLLPWSVSDRTAEWLDEATAASTARWRILVSHRPLWSPVRGSYGYGAILRTRIAASLPRIHLALCGHAHVYWDSTHEIDGHRLRQIVEVSGPKKYECDPRATGCVENSTGYLRIEVTRGELRVRRVTP